MKNRIQLVAFLLVLVSSNVWAQKYFTREAEVAFFSEAPAENIEAQNRQVTCILNTENGEIAFSVQMKGFHFEKALMEEHFNENYVESHKYPKATFSGKIIDFDKIDITKPGKHSVRAEGEMSLHGVKKPMIAQGEVSIADGKIILHSKFMLKVEDYKISIPKAVINKIAEEIEVTLNASLTEYNK